MANQPQEPALEPGLSPDDIRAIEGDALTGAHTGQNRTRVPEHTAFGGHGPKTRQRTKDIINRR